MDKVLEMRTDMINDILSAENAGFKISLQKIGKNNVDRDAWVMQSSQYNMLPTVYLNGELLDRSNSELADFLLKAFRERAKVIPDAMSLISREKIIGSVLPRLVSAENRQRLDDRDIAYMEFMDLLITFYISIPEMSTDEQFVTIQVTNRMIEAAGLNKEELRKTAIAHMEMETEIVSMAEMLADLMEMPSVPEEYASPIWVITNKDRRFGAPAAFLSAKVQEDLRERLGDRYALLPSSVHEALAVPVDSNANDTDFINMVREINETVVARDNIEDKLADQVYIYDHGNLTMVA